MTDPCTAEDTLVWPMLENLATCLCAEILSAGLPEPCFCGVLPGSQVAYDYINGCGAQCGMAWVRLVTAYPSEAFPIQQVQMSRCDASLAVVIEVGIVRCIEIEQGGQAPTPAQQLGYARQQMVEMAIMQQAIICCFDADVVLGTYTPRGPEGQALGGSWTVTVAVD